MNLQTLVKAPFRVARRLVRAVRGSTPAPAPRRAAVRIVAPPPPPAPARPPRAPLSLYVEETPNPDARKFGCGVPVVNKGSLVLPDARSALGHPLGEALFRVEGVASVFATRDFVTITRSPGGPSWYELEPLIEDVLQDVVER